jgi:hypothetical protein
MGPFAMIRPSPALFCVSSPISLNIDARSGTRVAIDVTS